MQKYMTKCLLIIGLLVTGLNAYAMFEPLESLVGLKSLTAVKVTKALDDVEYDIEKNKSEIDQDTINSGLETLSEIEQLILNSRIKNKQALLKKINKIKKDLTQVNPAPVVAQNAINDENEQVAQEEVVINIAEDEQQQQEVNQNQENQPVENQQVPNQPEVEKASWKFAQYCTKKNVLYFGIGAAVVATATAISKGICSVDLTDYNAKNFVALEEYLKKQTQKVAFNSDEFFALVSAIKVLNEQEKEYLIYQAMLGERKELMKFLNDSKVEILNRSQELSAASRLKMKCSIYLKNCARSISSFFTGIKSVFSLEEDEDDSLDQ